MIWGPAVWVASRHLGVSKHVDCNPNLHQFEGPAWGSIAEAQIGRFSFALCNLFWATMEILLVAGWIENEINNRTAYKDDS